MGVIACTWPFRLSTGSLPVVQWQQKRAYGLGWCVSWKSGLLRPRFCWGYLWLQVVIQKDQGSSFPELRTTSAFDAFTACHYIGLAPALDALVPLSDPGLASKSHWKNSRPECRLQAPRFRARQEESSFLNLLVEACRVGTQETSLRCWAHRWLGEALEAWAAGST